MELAAGTILPTNSVSFPIPFLSLNSWMEALAVPQAGSQSHPESWDSRESQAKCLFCFHGSATIFVENV